MRFDGLIGSPAQSLIPEWIYSWLQSSVNGRHLTSRFKDLFEAVGSRPVLPSALTTKCSEIGELLVEFVPGVLSAPVGGANHEEYTRLTSSHIPILKTTEEKIQASGIDPSATLAELGANSMIDLRALGFSWLQILDLAQCIAAWIQEPFPNSATLKKMSIEALADDAPYTSDATSFEELAQAFLSELIFLDGGRVSPSQLDLYLGRFGWGKDRLTLDEIGTHIGVTRERVRQISSRLLLNGAERSWPVGDAVRTQVAELITCGIFDDFDGFRGSWSLDSLVDLFERLGKSDIAESIRNGVSGSFQVPEKLKKSIRSARIQLGLISLVQLEINTGGSIPREHLKRAVQSVYAKTAFWGDWALAEANRETQIHNAVAVQFAMNDVVSVAELFEGVTRVQRGRSDGSPLPDLATFEGLLVASGLIDQATGRFIGEPYQFENIGTGFVHSVVRNAPGQIMHIDQLSEHLAELGVRPTTTAHYSSYQAGLRRTADGELVYAVGAELNPEQVRAARLQGDLISHQTDIQFDFQAGEIVFQVEVGTALLYRGAFTIPAAARSLVESEYAVECECGKAFDSPARISLGSQWNLSFLTNHLCVEHHLRPGRRIELRTQNSKLLAYF